MVVGGGNGGGFTTVIVADTEEYDGSTWTAGGNLNTTRQGLAGAGTQTTGLAFGGGSSNSATEEYNGTSWTTSTSMATGRYQLGGCGTQSSGLAFGVLATAITAATEEYTGAALAVKTITTSTS